MKTIHTGARKDRSAPIGAVIGLLTMIVALALAWSLTPAPASAETPAERCQRETTAYNNAWKAMGRKPPVPYKCGGNNDAPPTLAPTTTPDEAPDETAEPTTVAPESSGSGPNINTPTERRELEHPGTGQAPIGGGATSSAPAPRSSPSASSPQPGGSSTQPQGTIPDLLKPQPVFCPIGHNDDGGCRGAGVARGAWKWTKCVGAVAVVFVPTAKAYKAIKALGGVKETARLLWGAGSASEFLSITGGVGAEILGVSGVQTYCFD